MMRICERRLYYRLPESGREADANCSVNKWHRDASQVQRITLKALASCGPGLPQPWVYALKTLNNAFSVIPGLEITKAFSVL